MRGWFQELMERLAFRLMSVLSAKIETQLELELADTRAKLMTRAGELGAESAEGLPAIAKRLAETSVRLGHHDYLPAAHELPALHRLEQEHQQRGSDPLPSTAAPIALEGPTPKAQVSQPKRGRGRPPKATGQSVHVSPVVDDEAAGLQEGGNHHGQ